jgi:hypothetical protein
MKGDRGRCSLKAGFAPCGKTNGGLITSRLERK